MCAPVCAFVPQKAWEWVRGQILMEGREGTCLIALIKYLQAALTCLAVDTDPLLAINNALDAPVADGLLLDHH